MFSRLKVLAVLALLLTLTGCKEELYSKLSEAEANQMLAVLMANRIDVEKVQEDSVDGGFTLSVEKEDMLPAIVALNNAGLPKRKHIPLSKVFEKSGMISSPFEERVRYVNALGEELANTLTLIDGVVSARVHIVMPEEPELGQKAKPSSAAVFIKHRSDIDLDFQTPRIRRLVSSAIEDLKYSDVTVVLAQATETKIAAPVVVQAATTVEVLPGVSIDPSSEGRFWTIVTIVGLLNAALILFAVTSVVSKSKSRGRRSVVDETAVSVVEPS